jgi:hypothetical protein
MKHNRAITWASFSADGGLIVTASKDKSARIWDGKTGQPRGPEMKHDGELLFAAFSPDGKLVATAANDETARSYTARIWKVETGKPEPFILRHEGLVNHVSFSADGSLLATASDDKTARIWGAATGKPVTEPFRHEAPVTMAVFSPRGQILLTISKEKMARIWDATSGQMIGEPLTHEDVIKHGSFSSHGRFAITTGNDRAARIWLVSYPMTAPDWLRELAEIVGGYRISEAGGAESVPEPWTALSRIRKTLAETNDDNPFNGWGRWFLADRARRTTSPFSAVSVAEFARQYVESGKESYLREVLELQPDNALALAKLARLALNQQTNQADFYSALAVKYEPKNTYVLWSRAQVLHAQRQFREAYPVMETALSLDPRNINKLGPDGAEFAVTNLDASVKGWLPKGWEDGSLTQPVTVAYSKLNDPPPGETGLQISVTSRGRGQAILRGPRLVGKAGDRLVVQGWVRSSKRSDLGVAIAQFWEPNQKLVDQNLRTTEQWKQFKVPMNAPNDFAAELILTVFGDNVVDVAGVTVVKE